MKHRVAITGTGVISAIGDSAATLHSALCHGDACAYRPIEPGFNNGEEPRSGNILGFRAESYLKDRNLRPLDRTGQLVVAAAKLALLNSGWTAERLCQYDAGLALGTMFGSVHTIGKFDRQALQQGPACASPMDFANTVINAAAGQTAIWHNLRGINTTVASGSTSGLAALGYASDMIRSGNQTAMLAGGVDEFCFESFCGFERAGMLSHAEGANAFPVPFHSDRSGFVLGEAAGLLMLESWQSALDRGAHILAEVRGHGSTYDLSGAGNGEGATAIAQAMRAALRDAELLPRDLDCISASANGSVRADRDEALAIAMVMNGRGPEIPITAIKSMVGETLGASGALQAIDLVETITSGRLPGIRGLEAVDPRLPKLNLCREARTLGPQVGLVNAIGLDGNVDSLVISGPAVQ